MTVTEELADKLAARVIAHLEKTGDEEIVAILSQTLNESSQTLRDAFVNSLRVQRAALQADAILSARMAQFGQAHEADEDTADRPVPPGVV